MQILIYADGDYAGPIFASGKTYYGTAQIGYEVGINLNRIKNQFCNYYVHVQVLDNLKLKAQKEKHPGKLYCLTLPQSPARPLPVALAPPHLSPMSTI